MRALARLLALFSLCLLSCDFPGPGDGEDKGSGIKVGNVYGAWRATSIQKIPERVIQAFFPDSMTGYAVGQNGVVLKTEDGGRTWSLRHSQQGLGLTAVQFLDPRRGWIVGGSIYKTVDGGNTWTETVLDQPWGWTTVHFMDSSKGLFAGGGARVIKTTDGGLTWKETGTRYTQDITALHFVDAQNGYAVMPGWLHIDNTGHTYNHTIFLRTTNGGDSWISQSGNYDLSQGFMTDVHFVTPEVGVVVTDEGRILKTGDAGVTWSTKYARDTVHFYSVGFADSLHGWATGDHRRGVNNITYEGILLKTEDGGESWEKVDAGNVSQHIYAAVGVSPGRFILLAGTDKGTTITAFDRVR